MLLKCLPSGHNAQMRVNPDTTFFSLCPTGWGCNCWSSSQPSGHYNAGKKKPTQLLSPLCAVKFLFASVIYKEGSRTGKQTKENNVSINASKETCVANGFSETIGSEGVTLPLHWSGLIFLSHVNCLKSFAEFHSWIRTLLLCKWLLLF